MSEDHSKDRGGDHGGDQQAPLDTLPDAYFESVYAANADPWHFETSAYEDAKYAATLAALPRERYRRALEIGCSIGVLTRRLAERCGDLLALDVSERALEQARARNADRPQVHFERRRLPEQFPTGPFDLVVLSEVGYYWALPDLRRVLGEITGALAPGGQLIAVHWTPPVHDYPLTGDQVHAELESWPGLRPLHTERAEQYRLALLERPATEKAAEARSAVT